MLEIRRIEGRKALTKFVQFAIDLYKGYENYVPPIISMDVDTFDVNTNPAYQFCDAIFYMAYRDEVPVGRIAGFINHRANQKVNNLNCRFCWIDFIDDLEVSRLLLDTIAQWGKEHGMTNLVGPLGPTDIDNEGVLIEGFQYLPTTVNTYNAPYYQKHFEAYGMEREATWFEYRMEVPKAVPEKYLRMTELVKQRYGLRVFTDLNPSHLKKVWGHKLLTLFNESYAPIYGFTELTDAQIDYYLDIYVSQIPLDLVRMVVDKDDNMIAFGITMPSLSRAQQKAKGHMLPFGWFHLLRALKCKGATDTCDFMLIGVRPDYQGKGVNAMFFTELIPEFNKWGFKYLETNAELQTNHKVRNQWEDFSPMHHKTRCTYQCPI